MYVCMYVCMYSFQIMFVNHSRDILFKEDIHKEKPGRVAD